MPVGSSVSESSLSSQYPLIHFIVPLDIHFSHSSHAYIQRSLLLRPQHRLPNIRPRQPDIRRLLQLQHNIHGWEIRSRPLQCRDGRDIHICFRGEIFLGHGGALLVLELRAGGLQGFGDFVGDFFCGDGAVGSVDFG